MINYPPSRLRKTAAAAALLAGAAFPAFAFAADAAPKSSEVAEVIVTSQRRAESLQSVPVAVSVVTGDQLANRQTFSAEQLVGQIPSLTFRKGTTNVNSALNIRGIGTISFSSGAEPAVSTLVDGVVLARSGQAFFDFFDVERIEVLRGPQGTLFGKNASAGVVSIITKRPSATPGGFVEGSYFQDNESRVRAGYQGALSDTVRAGITGVYGKYDGNAKNLFTGDKVNGYERKGVRSKLEWTPNADLTATFIADWVKSEDNASADIIGVTAAGNAIIAQLAPVVPGPKNRNVNNDFAPLTRDTNWGLSAQLDQKLGDFTVTSITAFRGWKNVEHRDGDQTAYLGRYTGTASSRDIGSLKFHQLSQELRVASPTGQFLEYVVGGFFYTTNQDNKFNRLNLSCVIGTGLACPDGRVGTLVQSNGTARFNTKLTNYALFGQSTLNFTDHFRGIVGLRASHDRVAYDFGRVSDFAADTPGVRAAFASQGKVDKNGYSGRLGVQYDLAPSITAYANYARGYKGPAINVFFNMRAFDTIPLSPETSNAFELGLKSKLFDNRLVLNLAAYDSKYKGFQTTSFDLVAGSVVSRLINAGDVSTKGAEADFTARPFADFTVTGGAAYTDAKIDKFNCLSSLSAAQLASCVAHNGKTLPYAPKWKANIAADYRLTLSSLPFDIGVNAAYTWQDKTQFDIDQSPLAIQKAYGIIDAGLSFIDKKDRYRLTLVGKNLSDEYFTTIKIPGGFVRQQVPRDAERYFGVTLRANFGG